MNKLREWVGGAKWWHFWNPGSGLTGGAIVSALVLVVVFLCVIARAVL